jgi:hypothetical protein
VHFVSLTQRFTAPCIDLFAVGESFAPCCSVARPHGDRIFFCWIINALQANEHRRGLRFFCLSIHLTTAWARPSARSLQPARYGKRHRYLPAPGTDVADRR